MRKVDKIILHCADTNEDNLITLKNEEQDVGVKEIELWHKQRAQGFKGSQPEPWSPYTDPTTKESRFIGYHWVVRRNGVAESGRPESIAGCHCSGHNSTSIAICWIGRHRLLKDQRNSLLNLVVQKCMDYNLEAKQVYGHNEFSKKTCPNFNSDLTFKSMDQFREMVDEILTLWRSNAVLTRQ
jgi:N-acetylmuramoyl-L-alanine amidase